MVTGTMHKNRNFAVNTVFIILYEIIYRIMLFIKQSIMPISLFSLFLLRSCICSQFHYIQALLSAKDVLLSNPCLTYVFIYISNFFIILIINIIKNIQRRSRKKWNWKMKTATDLNHYTPSHSWQLLSATLFVLELN